MKTFFSFQPPIKEEKSIPFQMILNSNSSSAVDRQIKWIVYAIEQDGSFSNSLQNIKREAEHRGHKVYLHIPASANITDNNLKTGKSQSKEDPITPIISSTVPAHVNISRLLCKYSEEDTIVLRMNIGSDETYYILLDLMQRGLFKLIDYIDVSFSTSKSFNTPEQVIKHAIASANINFIK